MSVVNQMLLSLQKKQELFVSNLKSLKKERFLTPYQHSTYEKKGQESSLPFPTVFKTNTKFKQSVALSLKTERLLKQSANRSYALWSKEEEAALRTDYKQGMRCIKALGAKYQRTPTAIFIRLKSMSLIANSKYGEKNDSNKSGDQFVQKRTQWCKVWRRRLF